MRIQSSLPVLFCLLFQAVSSAQEGAGQTSTVAVEDSAATVFVLTEAKNQGLRPHVQILPDSDPGYGIRDILQPGLQARFKPYTELAPGIVSGRSYWGKLQLENRLPNAADNLEWVLNFSGTCTQIDVFSKDALGNWSAEASGSFRPAHLKKFVPTRSGNWVKVTLPPNKPVTLYFRCMGERLALPPNFHVFVQPATLYYDKLVDTKAWNALFTGFLLMMLLYNLINFFVVRDRSYFYYSGYLLMVLVYTAYVSDDLEDWLGGFVFTEHPGYFSLFKVCLYIGLMCWLTFIRSFLDLGRLLPKWDRYFGWLIWLGPPLLAVYVFLAFKYNFSYVIDDRMTMSYIALVTLSGFLFVYPLYKTKDPKGYFIMAGIAVISLGFLLTLLSRLNLTDYSVDDLKVSTIVEILIFSMGLAYRQRKNEEARQQFDFALKESQLVQEKRQIEAQRLQELNAFKSRFFTNITHEFRTPLTVILGMTERLTADGGRLTEQDTKGKLGLIKRNGENLLRLINQILDLAKLESKSLTINYVHGDVLPYLRYISESLHSLANAQNVMLRVECDQLRIEMDYDPERLQQIAYNLLSNAIKFTPSGGRVTLRAGFQNPQDARNLLLTVTDTGAGIPAEALPNIFDRFYQANNVEKAKSGGTGIGLALTKELVQAMGGDIEVESEWGKGTTFRVRLPITSDAPPLPAVGQATPFDTAALPMEPPESTLPLSGRREATGIGQEGKQQILLIEDNADVVEYLAACLEGVGDQALRPYELDFAYNGQAGIEKALENVPDLIVSDVMMPFKDGFEVVETLKNDERTSHIPIILLTAKADVQSRLAGLRKGADAYLSKPFHQEELLVTVANLLETRKKMHLKYQQNVLAPVASEPIRVEDVEDSFLQKVRSIIEAHYSEDDFGLPQLCQKIGMSRSQLFRKMKALTDIAPSDLIRKHRLNKAKALLKSGTVNVTEAAWEVGFKDPSYFSKLYQEEFGEAPSATRK